MTRYQAQWPDGFRVTWRSLTWAEFRKFWTAYQNSPFTSPADLFIEVYRACRLTGPVPEIVPAGIVEFISRQQLLENPLNGDIKLVRQAVHLGRSVVGGDYMHGARALIAAALNCSFEEMDKWDADTFFLRLAQAELVSGKNVNPTDPQAKQQPARPVSRAERTMQRVRERDSVQ